MNVVVHGLMTSYQKFGKGKPTLVLLHGWGTSSATFKQLIPFLTNNYTVLVLDLPGFGGTQMPETAWGLSDYAQFTEAWLKKINTEKLSAIIGHSFGGAVAITGVGQKILASEKLILLATSGIRNKNTTRKKILWLGAKAAKIPLKVLPSSKSDKIKKKLYSRAGSDLMLLPNMKETFLLTVDEDVQPSAKLIDIPTLLIYGEKDDQTPPADGRLLETVIPNSKLEILPNADHFLHQAQALQVAGMIDNFLGK